MNNPKILVFDLETKPLQSWVWQTGEQYINHKMLVKGHDQPGIICIGYMWIGDKKAKCIDWGYEEQDTRKVVEEFDQIAAEADLIIGKNSAKFDVPMLNATRMLNGLPGLPFWATMHDDLEKQMRKYFKLPSQSLDYISKHLGLGGKNPMEMQDWIDIVEKNDPKALTKMVKYCKKDVEDTAKVWQKLSEHFDSKFNMSKFTDERIVCKHADCGSSRLQSRGVRVTTTGKKKSYQCQDCGRWCQTSISSATGKESGIK